MKHLNFDAIEQLVFLGDTHGEVGAFAALDDLLPPKTAILQVGDRGTTSELVTYLNERTADNPVLWLDGNHDRTDQLWDAVNGDGPVETERNTWYLPRGFWFTVQGKAIGVLGGGTSVDKAARLRKGLYWSITENITLSQVGKCMTWPHIDFLVTHTPPESVIETHWPRDTDWLLQRELPSPWRDVNADRVEVVWNYFKRPYNVAGHMHGARQGPNYRVLDINEAWAPLALFPRS